MSKPATHDSDDEAPSTTETVNPNAASTEEEAISQKLAAQRLQDERATELAKLQAKQRAAVARDRERRSNVHPDLQDVDFGGSSASSSRQQSLPEPLELRHDAYGTRSNESLSDLSDYDSSDDDYQLRAASRRQSVSAQSYDTTATADAPYGNLLDTPGAASVNDDPFADPFFGEGPATPQAKERKEWCVCLLPRSVSPQESRS